MTSADCECGPMPEIQAKIDRHMLDLGVPRDVLWKRWRRTGGGNWMMCYATEGHSIAYMVVFKDGQTYATAYKFSSFINL